MPEEIQENAAAEKPSKRGRPRKEVVAPAVVVPPVPEVPNPAVLELQSDIVRLTRDRAAVIADIAKEQTAFAIAQAALQAAQGRLMALDTEVQYRMNVIRQLKGEMTPTVITGVSGSSGVTVFPGHQPVIGALPTPVSDPNDMVNRAHATRAML